MRSLGSDAWSDGVLYQGAPHPPRPHVEKDEHTLLIDVSVRPCLYSAVGAACSPGADGPSEPRRQVKASLGAVGGWGWE